MDGIEFIVNDKGERKAVVIDLEKKGNLWSEFCQFMETSTDKKESWLEDQELNDRLDKALDWNYNNPPQESNLDSLAKKFKINE